MGNRLLILVAWLITLLPLQNFAQISQLDLQGTHIYKKVFGQSQAIAGNGPLPADVFPRMEQIVSGYDIIDLNTSTVSEFLASHSDSVRVILRMGDGTIWPLKLISHKLTTSNTRIYSFSEGEKESPSVTHTYSGILDLPGGGLVRIAFLGPDVIGFVTLNGEKTFLENLGHLVEGMEANYLVSYKESAVVDTGFTCAVKQAAAYAPSVNGEIAAASCDEAYELEISTLATYERYQSQGSTVNGVNQHIVSLLNLVEPNYDIYKVKFNIVEQQVIDCDNCEPWGSSSSPGDLLEKFSDWGPSGFRVEHDMGICFYRGSGSGTVGVAWVGSVCRTFSRYNVCDLLRNSNSNRVLIAHEMGHNFGARHDNSGAPFIMAPSVNSSTQWSTASQNSIRDHISTRNCLSCITNTPDCTNPDVAVALTNAPCPGLKGSLDFSFVDQEGENIFEFSLDGGNTYPYESPDNVATFSIPNLDPGPYQIRVRVKGSPTCLSDLGAVTIEEGSLPTGTVRFSPASCEQADGSLTFLIPSSGQDRDLQASLDGGASFPYSIDGDADSLRIEGLAAGSYTIWLRWSNGDCPTAIDTVILIEQSTFAACDDGDPLTVNDAYDENCTCIGTVNSVSVQVTVMLEGFLAEGQEEMRTILEEKDLIPNDQPFSTPPFNYSGTESVADFSDDDVDWVLIEIRDSADIATVVVRQAAILTASGTIQDTARNDFVSFSNLPVASYYVAVYHLGHLAIVSATPIRLSNPPLSYDFTESEDRARGIEQLKLIGTQYGMYAGDYDGNGILNNLDFNLWKLNPSALDQYLPTDGDGNGIINNLDFNLWKGNGGKLGIEVLRN
ncbi:MAG: M12 family metallo-peptidase [Bacteroidota bacterium]